MKNPNYRSPNPRKRLLVLLIAIVALLIVGVGGTLAYIAATADPVINSFQSGSVAADVVEKLEDNQKKMIGVTNKGGSAVYVRVRLISYWQAEDGSVVAKPSPDLAVSCGSNWLAMGEYYYYTKPLAPGATTTNLLNAPLTMMAEDDCYQVIEVLADTVQAAPAAAVEEVWGVSASTFIQN